MELRPSIYPRQNAPPGMLAAAEPYEQRFGIVFSTLAVFDENLLRQLHADSDRRPGLPAGVALASAVEPSILARIQELTEIANASPIEDVDRRRYRSALTAVYEALPETPGWGLGEGSVLYVAPEREGKILAEGLGWLPRGHSLHPHAKRIPFHDGMLVGLSAVLSGESYSKAVIVDGAIASGATLIAIMESLGSAVSEFAIYSVHAAPEGVRAIVRYGASAGISVRLVLGHCSGRLNRKFYAVDPEQPGRLIVGDLGDMIAEIQAIRE